jgi:hypothetical protein
MNKTNYDALTETDLEEQLEWEHYVLHYNDNEDLELFTFRGGYPTVYPYQEQSTGEVFDSVQEAHKWVFTL